ncbi:MAG: phage baseplate protein [Gemmatimonadota bacterium]|nr:MAG: phage baseplate protein [Gemmatimonadota bacterium]
MRSLSVSELLSVWENGHTHRPIERALTLLAAACPDISRDSLSSMSIGQRDAQLLKLREMIFGSKIVSMAICPECQERLEITFNVTDILIESAAGEAAVFSFETDGYNVRFRLPNSLDLYGVLDPTEIDQARQMLFERCVVKTSEHGKEISANELPPRIMQAVIKHMAQVDPQADVRVALICSACGHKWNAFFDIVSFFWSEVSALTKRLLREVHILASTYGWCENDILTLSPVRRQIYMDLIQE